VCILTYSFSLPPHFSADALPGSHGIRDAIEQAVKLCYIEELKEEEEHKEDVEQKEDEDQKGEEVRQNEEEGLNEDEGQKEEIVQVEEQSVETQREEGVNVGEDCEEANVLNQSIAAS
jgi:hypothetical protein